MKKFVGMLALSLAMFAPSFAFAQASMRVEGNGGQYISPKSGDEFTVECYVGYNGIDSIIESRQWLHWDSLVVQVVEGTFAWGPDVPVGGYQAYSLADPNADFPSPDGRASMNWTRDPNGDPIEWLGSLCEGGCDEILMWSVDMKAVDCGETTLEFTGGSTGTNYIAYFNGPQTNFSPAGSGDYHLWTTDLDVSVTVGNCIEKGQVNAADERSSWSVVKELYQ